LGRKKVTLGFIIGRDVENFIAKNNFFAKNYKKCPNATRGLRTASGVYFSRWLSTKRSSSTVGNPATQPELLESSKVPRHFPSA
jgi:hypothetical protein